MASSAGNTGDVLTNYDAYLLEKAKGIYKKPPKTVDGISATRLEELTKEYLRDLPAEDVNKFFKHGTTPLTEAIGRRFVRRNRSCDPDSFEYENVNNNNNTKKRKENDENEKNDIVGLLIAKGADVNKVDRRGFSPLAEAIEGACEFSEYKCVILDLFKAGAKTDTTSLREFKKVTEEAKKAKASGNRESIKWYYNLANYVGKMVEGRMEYNRKKAKHNLKRFHFEGPMGDNFSEYSGGRRKTRRNKSKNRGMTRRR